MSPRLKTLQHQGTSPCSALSHTHAHGPQPCLRACQAFILRSCPRKVTWSGALTLMVMITATTQTRKAFAFLDLIGLDAPTITVPGFWQRLAVGAQGRTICLLAQSLSWGTFLGFVRPRRWHFPLLTESLAPLLFSLLFIPLELLLQH